MKALASATGASMTLRSSGQEDEGQSRSVPGVESNVDPKWGPNKAGDVFAARLHSQTFESQVSSGGGLHRNFESRHLG